MRRTVFAAILTVALLALTSCMTATGTESTISVSGSGTVYLKADMVTFSINVSETADTTAKAQQLTNEKMTKIFQILESFEISENDISTTALNFNTDYYWENGRSIKAGETVSQTVYVTMRDISSFPTLADRLGSELTGLSFYNVNFDSSEKAQASVLARELAYQNALEKAQSYAQFAGIQVLGPQSISENNTSYGNATYKLAAAAMVMEEAADYTTQAPSGQLAVTINVNVVFEVK